MPTHPRSPSPAAAPDHPGPRLVADPPHPACSVCVVIPVRDEAAGLPAALAALERQTQLDGGPLAHDRREVIVLANNCRDASAEAARAFALLHPAMRLHVVERTLPPKDAHVGFARRLLMEEACARLLPLRGGRRVIASTDGDTVVSPTWLAATLMEIGAGADAVGGRILAPIAAEDDVSAADRAYRAYHLRDIGFRHLVAEMESLLDPDPADPWPRHHQHFGASFAVTAAAYRRVGGLPAIPALEDVALHDALRRIDARIRHSPLVRVTTSTRRCGRVPVGLSTQLGEWREMAAAGRPATVPSAAATERRIRADRALRILWHSRTDCGGSAREAALREAAARTGAAPAWLAAALRDAASFGTFHAAAFREGGHDADSLAPVAEAVADLRLRLAALRRQGPLPAAGRPSSAALERVQPVVLRAQAFEVEQTVRTAFAAEEGLMDLVAG